MKDNKGFTLIELMIVVAIIGILAAIAIPSFVAMQQRAKRSELPMNLDAIRTAEKAYKAEYDIYVACALNPGVPSAQPQAWGTPAGGWDQIGWEPDGLVRSVYEVQAPTSTEFLAYAEADIDEDATNCRFEATHSIKSTMRTANDVY